MRKVQKCTNKLNSKEGIFLLSQFKFPAKSPFNFASVKTFLQNVLPIVCNRRGEVLTRIIK